MTQAHQRILVNVAIAFCFILTAAMIVAAAIYADGRQAVPQRPDGVASESSADSSDSPSRPLRPLFDAIRQVEPWPGDPRRVGAAGERGPYQITRAYWTDGCKAGGVQWSYELHVNDPARCEQVMAWYWQRYGAVTDEQRARMHNGGLDGPSQASTLPYWLRVKALMDSRATQGGGSCSVAVGK